jgi:MarR family transcriptional regulator, 2-MHQ and catechol-resistance regulon repressor
MTIDEEIQQTTWTSFRQKAMVNTMFTSRVLEEASAALLKEHDLTLPQFNILRILRGQKGRPATVKLLTERMLDKSSNASRLVDKLLEKNLVQRVSCPNDRRAVEVTITPAGLDILKRIDPRQKAWDAPNRSFTEDDAKTLSDLLDRLRAVVRAHAGL